MLCQRAGDWCKSACRIAELIPEKQRGVETAAVEPALKVVSG